MQVLVLAAQNAVEYRYLGVATSGSTLFCQIGGSIGVSIFGAIFANQLAHNLSADLPPGATIPVASDPATLAQLPSAVHTAYITAVTEALQPVFLTAAAVAVVAFALTWLLREVPLKTTSQAPDVGDGFHAARDDNAFRELERALTLLAGREQRWTVYERLATRAELDLPPPELWLLARLGERRPLTKAELVEQLGDDPARIHNALGLLERRSLARTAEDGAVALTTSGLEDYERLVEARCAGLRELLDGWEPERHAELRELIDRLARDLVREMPAPA